MHARYSDEPSLYVTRSSEPTSLSEETGFDPNRRRLLEGSISCDLVRVGVRVRVRARARVRVRVSGQVQG